MRFPTKCHRQRHPGVGTAGKAGRETERSGAANFPAWKDEGIPRNLWADWSIKSLTSVRIR